MADTEKPLLIKRYASRRLYNTETSDYVTLEDIAGFIREGREVQIVDLKSGDDLTRQYLLQIVAEHEFEGRKRAARRRADRPCPQLHHRACSRSCRSSWPRRFEMLRDSQAKMMQNLTAFPNPMAAVPGFDALRKQQEAFLKTDDGRACPAGAAPAPRERKTPPPAAPTTSPRSSSNWPSCRRNCPSSDRWLTPKAASALWGIEVFVAAAEEGSISAAARRLGVSPSAVSQQLSGLEAALGATLLDRSGRPMQVTPAGAMFRRHAQTILNAASEARAELAMADLAGMTTLRLGVIEDFDSDVTPHLLSQLWRGT